jgi:hypothetical protein
MVFFQPLASPLKLDTSNSPNQESEVAQSFQKGRLLGSHTFVQWADNLMLSIDDHYKGGGTYHVQSGHSTLNPLEKH